MDLLINVSTDDSRPLLQVVSLLPTRPVEQPKLDWQSACQAAELTEDDALFVAIEMATTIVRYAAMGDSIYFIFPIENDKMIQVSEQFFQQLRHTLYLQAKTSGNRAYVRNEEVLRCQDVAGYREKICAILPSLRRHGMEALDEQAQSLFVTIVEKASSSFFLINGSGWRRITNDRLWFPTLAPKKSTYTQT